MRCLEEDEHRLVNDGFFKCKGSDEKVKALIRVKPRIRQRLFDQNIRRNLVNIITYMPRRNLMCYQHFCYR